MDKSLDKEVFEDEEDFETERKTRTNPVIKNRVNRVRTRSTKAKSIKM
jgi:hypothetical protein